MFEELQSIQFKHIVSAKATGMSLVSEQFTVQAQSKLMIIHSIHFP